LLLSNFYLIIDDYENFELILNY